MSAVSLPVEGLAGARCVQHPETPATGTCARCGAFLCAVGSKLIAAKLFCGSCAERPDVNYLEAFRLKYWGKRDGWAWWHGFSAVFLLLAGLGGLITSSGHADKLLAGAIYLAFGAVGLCFFLGLKFARYAIVLLPISAGLFFAWMSGEAGVLAGVLVPTLVAVAIVNDTRNQLFFKVNVSEKKLHKAWHLYSNNQMARNGLLAGLFGVLFPPFALIGLACSIIGLRRVDPAAHPPVGRKAHAIAGIVASGLGLAWGTALLLAVVFDKYM